MIKTVSEKKVVLGADSAGFQLKEEVKQYLIGEGWDVTDITPFQDDSFMYHRVGFALGAKIAEGEFEKALAFDGSGMGIHVAASKIPHVHAAVAESVPAARRAAAANGCNLLAMGSFWIGPNLGRAMAEAFLESSIGDGYENWEGFLEYHLIGFKECEEFDYEEYKANGFQVVNPEEHKLGSEPDGIPY